MIKLYNAPHSTCSQKVRLCLFEKGIDFEDCQLVLTKFEHLTPDYLKINPNGVVPTLVHDGNSILDSSVIIEYLDEVFPFVSLTPADPVRRAAMRTWLRFFEEVPTVAVRFPSFNQALAAAYQEYSDDELAANANRRPLRKHFYEQMGRGGFNEVQIDNALQRFRLTVDRMETALQDGRDWLMGDALTLADCCVAPLVDRMDDLGLAWLWQHATAFSYWLNRWKQRPSYSSTFKRGARLSDLDPTVKERAAPPRLLTTR